MTMTVFNSLFRSYKSFSFSYSPTGAVIVMEGRAVNAPLTFSFKLRGDIVIMIKAMMKRINNFLEGLENGGKRKFYTKKRVCKTL